MSWVPDISAQKATDAAAETYESAAKAAMGVVPNTIKALSMRPEVMRAAWDLTAPGPGRRTLVVPAGLVAVASRRTSQNTGTGAGTSPDTCTGTGSCSRACHGVSIHADAGNRIHT